MSTSCPTSSSLPYPNSRSACALTSAIRPSPSTHIIASGAASSSPVNRRSSRSFIFMPPCNRMITISHGQVRIRRRRTYRVMHHSSFWIKIDDMASHVALLRGINLGGRNKIPMADLREVVTSLGHTGVTTYIQSGNVLFSTADTDTAKLAAALESAIEERFGIWSSVVVLSRDELAQVLAANPYPDEPNPKMVHVVFLNAELPVSLLDRISAAEGAAAAKGSRDTVHVAGPAAGQPP